MSDNPGVVGPHLLEKLRAETGLSQLSVEECYLRFVLATGHQETQGTEAEPSQSPSSDGALRLEPFCDCLRLQPYFGQLVFSRFCAKSNNAKENTIDFERFVIAVHKLGPKVGFEDQVEFWHQTFSGKTTNDHGELQLSVDQVVDALFQSTQAFDGETSRDQIKELYLAQRRNHQQKADQEGIQEEKTPGEQENIVTRSELGRLLEENIILRRNCGTTAQWVALMYEQETASMPSARRATRQKSVAQISSVVSAAKTRAQSRNLTSILGTRMDLNSPAFAALFADVEPPHIEDAERDSNLKLSGSFSTDTLRTSRGRACAVDNSPVPAPDQTSQTRQPRSETEFVVSPKNKNSFKNFLLRRRKQSIAQKASFSSRSSTVLLSFDSLRLEEEKATKSTNKLLSQLQFMKRPAILENLETLVTEKESIKQSLADLNKAEIIADIKKGKEKKTITPADHKRMEKKKQLEDKLYDIRELIAALFARQLYLKMESENDNTQTDEEEVKSKQRYTANPPTQPTGGSSNQHSTEQTEQTEQQQQQQSQRNQPTAMKCVNFSSDVMLINPEQSVSQRQASIPLKSILKVVDEEQAKFTRSAILSEQNKAASWAKRLQKGDNLKKISGFGEVEERWFSLSKDGSDLVWEKQWQKKYRNKKTGFTNRFIPDPRKKPLAEAEFIHFGFDHERSKFQFYLPAHIPPWLCFSIVFKPAALEQQVCLDIICKDEAQLETWLFGLQASMVLHHDALSRAQLRWKRVSWRFYERVWSQPLEGALSPLQFLVQLVNEAKESICKQSLLKGSVPSRFSEELGSTHSIATTPPGSN
eukprot:CAMPEP_0175124250 /NCGR_PEP_ID=MMETSP0087-20121206/2680_1 /TAXON_ID=136419 /ORGANISM="Unknown Unknown, Strain D1" /LENGTH=816 /DNA_ID=CAMNT_0016406003 /DNA_START=90 /DNA_END=2540 /DNA_ORIENTATION=+